MKKQTRGVDRKRAERTADDRLTASVIQQNRQPKTGNMLLNVTQLLANNHSQEILDTMMITHHAVLLPINFFAALLNGAAFATVICATSTRKVREIRLGSFAFIDSLCGGFGLGINILYLNGNIDCSANCALIFNPNVTSGPGVMVTLLRYSTDVLRAAHYSHFLLNCIYNWFFFVHPLQFQFFSRHRNFYMVLAFCWLFSLAGSLVVLVDGLKYHSDNIYFALRVYVIPVVHTLYTLISFGLD
ncbi:hypothetical protein ElyMa_000642900 [Elysia marginata]|uniref:G-protein coupled receptors family 1 profile domain-containing protein n=1 Tax=Elysia marginata TaxID=1093978 RepID=A0AAV4GDM2_9GAST|nr:hypothetical protein ElyMa_000642900 [Elysia marginata]